VKERSLTGPERFQKNRVTNSTSTSKQTRAEYPGKAVLGREAGVIKSNILNKKNQDLPPSSPTLQRAQVETLGAINWPNTT